MEGFPDDLVGDVRAIEVAGVDMVDASFDGGAEHGKRFSAVLRRAENTGAGQLHGPVAHAVDEAVAQGVGAGGSCLLHLEFQGKWWDAPI